MAVDLGDDLKRFNETVRNIIIESVGCEVDWPVTREFHPADAEFRAYGACPSCNRRRTVLLCSHCTDVVTSGRMFCSNCLYRGPRSDFFYRVEPLW